MDNAVPVPTLTQDEDSLLANVRALLPLLADLSRADVLLCLRDNGAIRVCAHARPRSIAPAYDHSLVGEVMTRDAHPSVLEVMEQSRFSRRMRDVPSEGAPIQRETYPLRIGERPPFGALVIDTNLLESERMRRRSRVFQQVIRDLKQMALRGEPHGAGNLSHFGEFDGLLFADYNGVIRYMSGIATNLYRMIGYTEALIGKPLSYLETNDADLFNQALTEKRAIERVVQERGREWVKKALPIQETEGVLWLNRGTRTAGVLIAVHDDTEARERQRELTIKTTMIKEVHHRVKNDLQTVAALLRMQSRRMQTEEARTALGEAVNRILSIAVIHEFLSAQDSRIINIRDIAGRILHQMQAGVLDPNREIDLRLQGPNILLTARQATSCALVINELLQNALEHGYDQRTRGGTISLSFQDLGDRVEMRVHDDGRGLPLDFDLNRVDSLGLRIVRMLVTDDLKGTIDMQSDNGVSAIVNFPKIPLGGDEAWSEQE
ncbi:MAG TPA: histidine kinase N-terminal domain-containing protein [Anaerolineae bacterium]|nr:histidine kinase N-terminal domain-containing protein [Anaerolineae bacterium]